MDEKQMGAIFLYEFQLDHKTAETTTFEMKMKTLKMKVIGVHRPLMMTNWAAWSRQIHIEWFKNLLTTSNYFGITKVTLENPRSLISEYLTNEDQVSDGLEISTQYCGPDHDEAPWYYLKPKSHGQKIMV